MLKSTKAMLGRYVEEVRHFHLDRMKFGTPETVIDRLECRLAAMEYVLGINPQERCKINEQVRLWASRRLAQSRRPRKSKEA